MSGILFYDSETSGLPDWKSPSESETQPHIVQLGAILANAETREVIEKLDVIIKPDGWVIPDEVSKVHGITTEHALEVGMPESEALQLFTSLWAGCMRVAHNKTFDQRIIRIAMKRFNPGMIDVWSDKDSHLCTMQMAKPVMQMGQRGDTDTSHQSYLKLMSISLENPWKTLIPPWLTPRLAWKSTGRCRIWKRKPLNSPFIINKT